MKEDIYNELENLSPLLADIKKAHPDDAFKTPKFYFDTLADKVLAEAKAQTAASTPPQYPSLSERLNGWLSTLWQPRLALALGSFGIIAATTFYIFTKPQTTIPIIEISEGQPTTDDIQTYIHDNIDDFDEETIIENSVPKTADTEGGQQHPKSGLTEEELEHFLSNDLEEEDLENL
jgi:hypothetical protein